jgi:ABC-type sugar transport system substrate-binding protein
MKPLTSLTAATLVALGIATTAPARADDITIGYAVPSMADAFWSSASYGVSQEAKKEGVKLITLDAGSDTNVSQQVGQVADLIQRHVNAIIIGATNGDAMKAITERAIASGIPVVGFSSPPSSKKLASDIGADHYDMGRLQARCLGAALKGQGEVAMLAFVEGQVWSDVRAKGFKDTMAKEYPNIKIVAENRRAVSRADGITATEDIMQRFPNLRGLYTTIDELAAGAVTALKADGKAGQVTIATSNLTPIAQQMLRDGEVACSSIQQVVAQGNNAVIQAVKAARKQPTTPEIMLPSLLITKANLDKVDMGPIEAPASWRP